MLNLNLITGGHVVVVQLNNGLLDIKIEMDTQTAKWINKSINPSTTQDEGWVDFSPHTPRLYFFSFSIIGRKQTSLTVPTCPYLTDLYCYKIAISRFKPRIFLDMENQIRLLGVPDPDLHIFFRIRTTLSHTKSNPLNPSNPSDHIIPKGIY